MSQLLVCPGCRKQLRLAEPASNQTVRCPQCGISFAAADAVAAQASEPQCKPSAGIADRPLPVHSGTGAARFEAAGERDRPTTPRPSSNFPLVLVLVLGGVFLLLGGIAIVVMFGLFFWMTPQPTPAPTVAVTGNPAEEMGDQRRMVQHGQWEQPPPGQFDPNFPGGIPGPPGLFDPNKPMGIQEISGPDEKGRLSFSTSAIPVSVAFLDAGKTLVAASSDGEVRLWDLEPPKKKSVIPPGRREEITDMALAPDGKTYVTVSHGGAVQIMDVATKQEKGVLAGSQPAGVSLWAVAYSPTGKVIATAHGNNVVKLWDVQAEKLTTTLNKHTGQVSSLAFSRDGKLLASGGFDTTVIVWNVAEQQAVATIKPPGAADAGVGALAFAPDGNLLAFGGNDTVVHLWDLKKKEDRAVCRHLKEVRATTFSPDGRFLATASSDGTVRLWDGVTGERRALLQTDYAGPMRRLAFSPDSKKLAVTANGVLLFDLTKVEMLKGP